MPPGIYKRTKEIIEKNKGTFKKGNVSWMKGKHHSKESKKKMSESSKGKIKTKETRLKLSKANRGEGNAMFGKNHSEETKKKISESRIRLKIGRGKDNPSWKGGITPENTRIRNGIEFRLWREAVFARDNWVCQECKKRGSQKLHAHHILNFAQYPELRFAIDNGMSLCKKCHIKFHSKYGKKNNTKKQLEEFLCAHQ